MPVDCILEQLGIPGSYGRTPPLPRFGEPEELTDVGPNIIGRPQHLTPVTAKSWATMTAAAATDSVELLIVSGFRSIADQALLITKKLEAGQTIDAILQVNAAPGFSQHHTGRAIDIATPGTRPLTEAFGDSPAFHWLEANADRFGFVLPYGLDNEWGMAYEPWHWFFDMES